MTASAPNGIRSSIIAPMSLPLWFACDERLIQRLAAIAFLHDLGKANRGFQNKIHAATASADSLPGTAGHGRELWPLLRNPDLQSA